MRNWTVFWPFLLNIEINKTIFCPTSISHLMWCQDCSLQDRKSQRLLSSLPLRGLPGRIITASIDLRIRLRDWRGVNGGIPRMASLYWRIYYQIETLRIGELKWRETADRWAEMEMKLQLVPRDCLRPSWETVRNLQWDHWIFPVESPSWSVWVPCCWRAWSWSCCSRSQRKWQQWQLCSNTWSNWPVALGLQSPALDSHRSIGTPRMMMRQTIRNFVM